MGLPALEVKTINGAALAERCAAEGNLMAVGNLGIGTQRWSGETMGYGSIKSPNILCSTFIKTISLGLNLDVVGAFLLGQYISSGSAIGSSASTSGIQTVRGTVNLNINALVKIDRQNPDFRISSVLKQDPRLTIAIASTSSTALNTSKVINSGSAQTGRFAYTLTVTNTSGSSTSGTITILDILPPGLRFISGAGTGFTISESSGLITATTSDVIANNGTKTYVIQVAVTEALIGGMNGVIYEVSNDVNLSAPAIWWNGTSITAGTAVTEYKFHYTFLIRNFIRDTRGIPNRIVNKAIGGTSSSSQELLRKFDNRYDPIEPPLAAFFEHGINDSAQNVPTSTTTDNFLQYLNHWRRINEKMPVIALAPFPTGDTTNEAKNATLHTAMLAFITNLRLTDPNVYYITGTRNMFNPSTESGTYTTDNIHLNNAGNILVQTQIQNFIIDNNIFTS